MSQGPHTDQGSGHKVVTRIELAAALLASACDHAFDGAEATGTPGDGANFYAMAERLVLQRARELYAQGSA